MTDLSHMTYGELVDSLRKDLQLDLRTDALPNTFPVVSGLLRWSTPTLINAWVPTGALPLAQPGYLKDPLGFVHLKGRVKGGTTGTVVFVLPQGFRPGSTDLYSSAQGSLVTAFVAIDAAGNVVIDSTSTTDNALGGITFLAEN